MLKKANVVLVLVWFGVALVASVIFALLSTSNTGGIPQSEKRSHRIYSSTDNDEQSFVEYINEQKMVEFAEKINISAESSEYETILGLLNSDEFQQADFEKRLNFLLELLVRLEIHVNKSEVENFLQNYADFDELALADYVSLKTINELIKYSIPKTMRKIGETPAITVKRPTPIAETPLVELPVIDQATIKQQILTAIDQGNLSMCDQLTDSSSSKKCQNTIFRLQALNDGDITKCANIHSEYEIKTCLIEVYFSKALSDSDKSLCEKIEIENVQKRCLDSFT